MSMGQPKVYLILLYFTDLLRLFNFSIYFIPKNKPSFDLKMSSQSDRVRHISTTSTNKFRFSDYGFAHFVRERMLQILPQFDHNGNQLFQEQQIKNALVNILNENPNELYYVVQNVFRYDKDNDHAVTYKQFIDFSVEQHFGEMAIQRLHRQKMYAHGDKRIMSLPEFIKTMEYSLNTIGIHGPDDVYQLLFSQVDRDQDGFISYEDYFIFLKEYFGSKSGAAEPVAPPTPKPDPFEVDNGAAQRFAKLIYTQLKITVMQIDYNRKMKLEAPEVQRFVSQVMQANEQETEEITALVFNRKGSMDYEEFLQFIVPFYFCEFYVNVTGLRDQRINLQLFLQVIKDATTSVVAVGPSEKTAKSIFYLAAGTGDNVLNIEQYVRLMGTIFQNFRFDRRGLGRSST